MYLLRFSSLSLHDEENDGDGTTQSGRYNLYARRATGSHGHKVHVVSKSNVL
jgi:hypothetical protein